MITTGPRPPGPAPALLCVFAVWALAVEVPLLAGSAEGPLWVLMTLPLTGVVYVLVGALAWARRPSNRTGALFCVGGLVWLTCGLANTTVPVLIAAGTVVATVPVAVVLHALLAFPSGRLRHAPERALAVAGYVATTVLEVPTYLFAARPAPYDALLVADRPDLLAVSATVQTTASVIVLAGAAAVLVRKLVLAGPGRRRALGPVYAYGAFALLVVWALAHLHTLVDVSPLLPPLLQIAVLAGVPVAFGAGVMRGGFARTGRLEELAATLGRSGDGDIGAAVASTLGDPSLELAFRVDRPSAPAPVWVDAAGRPTTLPDAGERAWSPVTVGGATIAALVYDRALLAEDEVGAAGRIVALAADHQRLTAQLLAGREELRESRTRLVEAGDRERRRLARDLHDRLQNRLVLLSITVAGADAQDRPELYRRGLDEVLEELRRLVQGVLPALLIERGLVAAVRDLAARCPVPVALHAPPDVDAGLPAAVESTAYHVVSEAVTNALKHSGASALTVALRRPAGALAVEVADDGVGGARAGGLGLQGMADRAAALDGTFSVASPAGDGTRIVVEIPCGS